MNSATLDADGLSVRLNFADQGGGFYVDSTSSLTLSTTSIQGNRATDGGGINSEGSVTLTNVLSAFNQATGDGGGLLLVDTTLAMTNATLAGDTGTALYLSGTTSVGTVRNSIIYGASGYGVLVSAGSSFTGTYNDVYLNTSGNYSGTANVTGANGNISAVPGFTAYTNDGNMANDTFYLASGSACTNTGNPSAAYNDVDATRNDMGAYGGPGGGW
jgi:predicted outer membrane repeat protein